MYQILKKMHERYPDIKGLLSNIPIKQRFTKALSEIRANRKNTLKTVVFDFSKETKNCLEQDIIQAAVTQRPFHQGYYAIHLLYNYLSHSLNEVGDYYVNLDIAFKENIDQIENTHLF